MHFFDKITRNCKSKFLNYNMEKRVFWRFQKERILGYKLLHDSNMTMAIGDINFYEFSCKANSACKQYGVNQGTIINGQSL